MCHASTVDGIEHLRVTIVTARYGGIYEHGLWLAFPSNPDALPVEWDTDDVTASAFYQEHSHEIGAGGTPDEAYSNLRRILTGGATHSDP
jgi:hypothetical protein